MGESSDPSYGLSVISDERPTEQSRSWHEQNVQ
jgi:hypothetical protein